MTPELQVMYWLQEMGLSEHVTDITREYQLIRAWRVDTQGRRTYLIDFYFQHPILRPQVLADPLDLHPHIHIGFRRRAKKWLASRKSERKGNTLAAQHRQGEVK